MISILYINTCISLSQSLKLFFLRPVKYESHLSVHRTTAKCNPMSHVGNGIGNTLCKDEIINEWNVRLNEIKDNVSKRND